MNYMLKYVKVINQVNKLRVLPVLLLICSLGFISRQYFLRSGYWYSVASVCCRLSPSVTYVLWLNGAS